MFLPPPPPPPPRAEKTWTYETSCAFEVGETVLPLAALLRR